MDDPAALEVPTEWRRVEQRIPGARHPFDQEVGSNPYVEKPTCSSFESWDARKIEITLRQGALIKESLVERYYSYWQVHVIELLRSRKFYEQAPFLAELPESSYLHYLDVPVETEQLRNLQGMARGYDLLTRFTDLSDAATSELRKTYPFGSDIPEAAQVSLRTQLGEDAKRLPAEVFLDEAEFFGFVAELLRLLNRYQSDERAALSEDVERDLELAQLFAYYAFGQDWAQYVGRAEQFKGKYYAGLLRDLDPIDVAAREAERILKGIATNGTGMALTPDELDKSSREIVDFCIQHELFEALQGISLFTFTEEDVKKDRYPGFLFRRLRPLAFAVEQLARGILELASLGHPGDDFTKLMITLGDGQTWLPSFNTLMTLGFTSDKVRSWEAGAVELDGALRSGLSEEEVIARTLILAVAGRNVAGHRHRIVPREFTEIWAGACAKAVIFVWITAQRKGLV